MKVAAIIPTIGRPHELRNCLAALSGQTQPPSEILVVHPDPDAVTATIAETYGARVVLGSRRGATAQRNRGIAALSPDVQVALFLDDDVVLAPDHIERLVEVLAADAGRRIGGVSGVTDSETPDEALLYRAWRRLFLGARGAQRVTPAGVNLPKHDIASGDVVRVEWLHGASAYRAELLEHEVWDEQLEGYTLYEDVDFSLRVGRRFELAVVGAARLDHRQSPVGRVGARDAARLFVRNRLWLVRRHRPGRYSLVLFWWTTFGYLAAWAALALRGDEVAAAQLRGALDGIADVRSGLVPPSSAPVVGRPAATITVVVATLPGREDSLRRCLAGIEAQTRPADDVLVLTGLPSMVAVLREGLAQATTGWVAFIDDDAIPQRDWLEVLSRHMGDPTVGAVGGRILNFYAGRTRARRVAGGRIAHVNWYGRTVERLEQIPERHVVADVAFLRGSNMCLRRAAVPHVDVNIDVGMAPGNETAIGLGLQRAGWVVRFDSDALVTHYPAPRPERFARDDRTRFAREYGEVVTYTILKYSSWPRRLAFLVYFFLVGQRASPGLALAPYFLMPGKDRTRYAAAWAGKIRGLRKAFS